MYKKEALNLLQDLIRIPSFSGKEDKTGDRIEKWFEEYTIPYKRIDNNIISFNKYYDDKKPLLLLNSHHDTVKPNEAYTLDPFEPIVKDKKLYGLGSNDAGGCLVSLIAVFTYFYNQKDLAYNIVIVASAEEEDSRGGKNLKSVIPHLPKIDLAIVGEPTLMNLAIAEKGLVVFDAEIEGTPSHAAHPNNNNAILKVPEVLNWFANFSFDKVSDILGEVKITVTQINAGSQHNVIPAKVHLVIDVRVNDCYSNAEINEILQKNAPCKLTPRTLDFNSSSIPKNHPLVLSGIDLGRKTYGSPTLSDQASVSCPSVKLGPGDSLRSHSANEFIYIQEIEDAIDIYTQILSSFLLNNGK